VRRSTVLHDAFMCLELGRVFLKKGRSSIFDNIITTINFCCNFKRRNTTTAPVHIGFYKMKTRFKSSQGEIGNRRQSLFRKGRMSDYRPSYGKEGGRDISDEQGAHSGDKKHHSGVSTSMDTAQAAPERS
jgi:hypothetical protein